MCLWYVTFFYGYCAYLIGHPYAQPRMPSLLECARSGYRNDDNGTEGILGRKRALDGIVAEEAIVAGSWGKYQISRTAVASVTYSGIRILVYKKLLQNDGEYYFAPALFINASSTTMAPNRFDRRFEVRFDVIMYSDRMVAHIRRELQSQLNLIVNEVRVIPVEEMRILPNTGMDSNIEIDSMWKSYATQPATISFRALCTSMTICEQLAHNIREYPTDFVANVEVQYTMQSQKSAARRLRVTVENIHNSQMFTELNQRFKNQDYAYLGASDAKQIKMEVMGNVMAAEVSDAEFLTKENMPTIVTLIDQALNFQQVETNKFQPQMWNSVFWSDENGRPDRVARELQDQYDQMSTEKKEAWAKSQADSTSKEECGNAKVGVPDKGSISVEHCEGSKTATASANEETNESLNARVNKNKVIVIGDKIIPKSMDLKRANLAELRQKSTIESTQVRISSVQGVLKSNLNVGHKTDLREVFFIRAKNPLSGFTKSSAEIICRDYYNALLATLRQLKIAWAHGASWCHLGHVQEHIAYPGRACFRKASASSTYQAFCDSPLDMELPGIVIVDPAGNSTDVKTGFNCFGVKPHKLYTPTIGTDVLLTAWFSTGNYSQYF
ncbi:uncharacterized protein LOC129602194 isoform X2 [Paramacrobiotus metropolitanus]|uniref:uncharacterized protein LOC129602194 isoform X2 n=1 Tax=Paramacrobiotus metropolitanus TaxID=2943436 RepID=UPI002445CC6C|nr:uncharacterized protein LOC129602194 isoform X2 [Paramacrobiotus metropolitanus]